MLICHIYEKSFVIPSVTTLSRGMLKYNQKTSLISFRPCESMQRLMMMMITWKCCRWRRHVESEAPQFGSQLGPYFVEFAWSPWAYTSVCFLVPAFLPPSKNMKSSSSPSVVLNGIKCMWNENKLILLQEIPLRTTLARSAQSGKVIFLPKRNFKTK